MPQINPCVADGSLPPDLYTDNLNTQLTYNINFDFVDEADVVVYREFPEGTFTLLTNSAATGATPPNYTINMGVSPHQVTFNPGEAPGGTMLIVGRRTDICEPVVTFQVGAAIRAGDLNASVIQLLHLIQEMRSTLGFMINGNDTDPIIPGQGMDLDDLDDVDVAGATNRSWFYFNGNEWVDGRAVQSGEDWISNNETTATTAAMDERFTDATADTIGLVWVQDGADPEIWRATQFRTAPGVEPVDITATAILPQGTGNADVLVINLAGQGQAVIRITAPLLDWDVASPGFSVRVENPAGVEPFVSAIGTPFVQTAGTVTANRDAYQLGNPTPAYAAGATTTQQVNTVQAGDTAVIQSNSADQALAGGTATATIPFVFSDGSANPPTAVLTQNWRTPAVNLTQTVLPQTLFLQTIATHTVGVGVTGITTAGNAATALDSDRANDAFNPAAGTGNFNSVITFNPELNWDSDAPEIETSTVFTRPAGVAAVGGYATPAQEEDTELTLRWLFPNSFGTGAAAPTAAQLVTAQNTLLGTNQNGFVCQNVPPGQPGDVFWFVSRTPITGAEIVINGVPAPVFGPVIGTRDLQPTPLPAGYPACEYNIISFNWPVQVAATVNILT